MKIRTVLKWSALSIAMLFIALVFTPLGQSFVNVAGSSQINYEIPQKIGGTLIVTGEKWMDIHSFGDITNISYKPKGTKINILIGQSDYYGRNFSEHKQISLTGRTYWLAAGDRLNGDKIYASKNLEEWKSFTFSRESILKTEHANENIYLPRYYPDRIFLDEEYGSAYWIRRVRKGSDLEAQKLRFKYTLDWTSNKMTCSEIVEIINDVKF